MDYYLGAFRKYATFTGRARRTEYWMFVLFNLIAYVVLACIGVLIHTPILTALYGLFVLIPSLAIAVRRLHDTGRSGWWILIGLVPLIGAIIIIVFACLDSQPGDNMYGPNPKAVAPVAPTI